MAAPHLSGADPCGPPSRRASRWPWRPASWSTIAADRAGAPRPGRPASTSSGTSSSIMQENRSFDSYFGTYPGADGIPMRHGRPSVCVPDPATADAVARTTTGDEVQGGGPHRSGRPPRHPRRPHGWLRGERRARPHALPQRSGHRLRAHAPRRHGLPRRPRDPQLLGLRAPLRAPGPHVRADRVVEPARAPLHGLGLVGPVPAIRSIRTTCVNAPEHPQLSPRPGPRPHYAWTDLTWLLHRARRELGLLRGRREPSPTATTTR